jgi:hypothetical protein
MSLFAVLIDLLLDGTALGHLLSDLFALTGAKLIVKLTNDIYILTL